MEKLGRKGVGYSKMKGKELDYKRIGQIIGQKMFDISGISGGLLDGNGIRDGFKGFRIW